MNAKKHGLCEYECAQNAVCLLLECLAAEAYYCSLHFRHLVVEATREPQDTYDSMVIQASLQKGLIIPSLIDVECVGQAGLTGSLDKDDGWEFGR